MQNFKVYSQAIKIEAKPSLGWVSFIVVSVILRQIPGSVNPTQAWVERTLPSHACIFHSCLIFALISLTPLSRSPLSLDQWRPKGICNRKVLYDFLGTQSYGEE